MNIASGINWTKLVIALALVCLMSGFSALAQTTPKDALDAKAVSALIEELKDGLPDLIEDEAQITAIGEKWDEREDLAGKTKAEILKLLFADVKSLIEDKDTQDNVWTNWVSEEKTEEKVSVETPQKPAAPTAKPVEQSSCRANAINRFNQVEAFGFISVGYRLLRATGTVWCFDEQKGFGFIVPDDGGPLLFVHVTSINMGSVRTLREGQKVQYEVQTGRNGQPVAVNVRNV